VYTLERTEIFEQDIRKSRFRAIACPVEDEASARAAIAIHSQGDANHNCWAWRIGQAYRFNDDGEPGGTAGKPILQAIDGQALDQTLVVVTRWFGGILLGSGGLIRAYGGTAAACLRSAGKIEVIALSEITVCVDFSDLARVKARLSGFANTTLRAETYHDTGADLALSLPAEHLDTTVRAITDLTSGRARIDLPQ
jgi:uncharacterized YigZ family protein